MNDENLKNHLLFTQAVAELYQSRAVLQIQFLKQGPAHKKEGPDPNKGSNQQ